ncbi:MAG TPA: MarR family transcriptional regulator [Dehalococcoidia bacterium]|nr:MarR family transcriptional regulator [Dehalococcoidia bacterium]
MSDEARGRMLGALLRIPFQAIVRRIHAELREEGFADLTPAHFVVFQHLPEGGARLTDLADSAQMTKQSMAYLVDFLSTKGYVERIPDAKDARARLVRLTEKGREVESIARRAIAALRAEWAEVLGREQMAAFEATLRALVDVIEGERERPRGGG